MAFDKQVLNNEVDIIAKLAVGGDYDFGLLATVGADRYFRAIGVAPNIFINFAPKGNATLRVPAGYELGITDVKDLINKAYGDGHVAGKALMPNLINPTPVEDGYSIVWDEDSQKFALAPSLFSKTFASGVEDVDDVIKLGGLPLDRHTEILGVGTYDLRLGLTTSKLQVLEANVVQKIELTGGTAKLILNSTEPVKLLGGAVASTFVINAGGGFILTDNQGGSARRGLRGADDYSPLVQDNDYIQKVYTDNRIATKPVNAIVKAPTSAQNGFAIVWNQAIGQYTLGNAGGASVSTIPKIQKFIGDNSTTAWTVTSGTILYINFVDINGNIQEEGVDYSRSGQIINISPPVPTSHELTIRFWEDLSLGVGGGGGTVQNGHFLFNTGVTAANPGSGKISINNAALDLASEIYINNSTSDGINIGAALADMATGDSIRLQLSSNDDNNAVYRLASMPVDNGGWWTLSVVNTFTAGSLFADLSDLVVILLFGGSSTDEGNIDGGRADSIYNTIPGMDGGGA
jgi:hypothetical protein